MKKLLFISMGLLIIALTNAQTVVGEAAPAFAAPDSNGEIHRLKDYAGKIVVLEWKNHQCPFVVKHYSEGNMQGLQKEYTAKGVVWFSIVSSAPGKQGYVNASEANAVVADEGSAASAVLLDPSGSIGRRYAAKTTPHMFVIGKNGNIAYQGAIDSIRSRDPDDIPEATNYVRDALNSILAGKEVEVPESRPYGCSVKY